MATKPKDKATEYNGHNLVGIMPNTRPGVQSLGRMLVMMGADNDTIIAKVLAVFDDMVKAKGEQYVIDALLGASDAADKARAQQRAKDNRAKLDAFNQEHSDDIASAANLLIAAQTALQDAKDNLAKLQKDAAGVLDVNWPLDVQLIGLDDDNPRFYVPSDSLGSKPKSKSKGRSGTRGKRQYDFSKGKWSKTVKTGDYGTLIWDVTGTGTNNNPFVVSLTWDNPKTGNPVTQKSTHDSNMSTAAKTVLFACAQDYNNPKKYTAPNKIPLNMPSMLGIDFDMVDNKDN